MTIEQYCEKHNLPEMRLLGEMKYFKYYMEKNLLDEDNGIPMIIEESKADHGFNVCDSDQAMNVMRYF